jgi:hypothetical protein
MLRNFLVTVLNAFAANFHLVFLASIRARRLSPRLWHLLAVRLLLAGGHLDVAAAQGQRSKRQVRHDGPGRIGHLQPELIGRARLSVIHRRRLKAMLVLFAAQ